jgi:hypothetical protein
MKATCINDVAEPGEKVAADVREAARGMSLDKRVGRLAKHGARLRVSDPEGMEQARPLSRSGRVRQCAAGCWSIHAMSMFRWRSGSSILRIMGLDGLSAMRGSLTRMIAKVFCLYWDCASLSWYFAAPSRPRDGCRFHAYYGSSNQGVQCR